LVPGGAEPRDNESIGQGSALGIETYVRYQHHVAYKLDNGLVFLPVKKADVDDIVQRVRNPQVFLIQSGEAIRHGAKPEVPPPLYRCEGDSPIASLISAEVALDAPDARGMYKASWQYVMKMRNAPQFMKRELRLPYSKMVSDRGWLQDAGRTYDDFVLPSALPVYLKEGTE